jgi:D-3-phosphoglycerate dehydrogenase
MLGMIDRFADRFAAEGVEVTAPTVVQTLGEDELVDLVAAHDGWIIGDDPATRRVFEAGRAGRLRAAVKWGIGVDNVDLEACDALGLPITNTPGMFGGEVADLAMGYVVALARETFSIDRGVRAGGWPKPRGISLAGRTVALVGFGDIGRNAARRFLAADMNVIAYDPFAPDVPELPVTRRDWPQNLEDADFLVLTCALTESSHHMVDASALARSRRELRVVNVGRGPVVDQVALEEALRAGHVHSAALDVFEIEPLPEDAWIREHPRCIFGSHNASNTEDAVIRTSELAIDRLLGFLRER